MKPVSPSPPEQERHTIQYPATQSTSTHRTSASEQVQKNTSPVQNYVPVQSRSTPTITRGKPIIKTAVLNPELKPKTSTIPELIRLQEKKTDSDKKSSPELTTNKVQAPNRKMKTKASTIPDLFRIQEKKTDSDKKLGTVQ